jgi:arylsulfatase A-like enzyme
VKWPAGTNADEIVEEVVALTDLAPTFLSFADAGDMGDFNGAVLPRQAGSTGREVYSEGMFWGIEKTALTTRDYKLIYCPYAYPSQPKFEVYDRAADRAEHNDLADSEAAAEQRRRLVALASDSQTAAEQWEHSGKQEFHGIDLSNATREKLRTLGYIGD